MFTLNKAEQTEGTNEGRDVSQSVLTGIAVCLALSFKKKGQGQWNIVQTEKAVTADKILSLLAVVVLFYIFTY